MDMIAEIENAIWNLDDLSKAEIRMETTNSLKRARLPKDNMSKGERQTLKGLEADESIIILKADKGNKIVVMDRTVYDEKILNMLNDQQTCKKLKKDPRNVCEKEMKKLLSSKAERMDEKLLKKLKTTDGPTPRIYGLPKNHKNNNPLRPIVSFSGSTTYQLSKYLSLILDWYRPNIISAIRTSG